MDVRYQAKSKQITCKSNTNYLNQITLREPLNNLYRL